MKTYQQKKNLKKIIALSCLAIFLVVGVVLTYLYLNAAPDYTVEQKDNEPNSSNADQPTTTEKTAETQDSSQRETTRVEDKTPIQYEGEDQSTDVTDPEAERFRIPESE